MGIDEYVTTTEADRFEIPGAGSWGGQVLGEHLVVATAIYGPGEGLYFHYHPNQEEVIHVISGSVEMWVDREHSTLNPGDSVRVPVGVVHRDFNASDSDEARVLVIAGPKVDMKLEGHRVGTELVDVSDEEPCASIAD